MFSCSVTEGDPHKGHLSIGLWLVTGILTFLVIEKVFTQGNDADGEPEQTENTQVLGLF